MYCMWLRHTLMPLVCGLSTLEMLLTRFSRGVCNFCSTTMSIPTSFSSLLCRKLPWTNLFTEKKTCRLKRNRLCTQYRHSAVCRSANLHTLSHLQDWTAACILEVEPTGRALCKYCLSEWIVAGICLADGPTNAVPEGCAQSPFGNVTALWSLW